jgi:hypothetical protein
MKEIDPMMNLNLNQMFRLVEEAKEFREYLRDFYGETGIYDYCFTDEEIMNGMNEYFQTDEYLEGILVYGADTVDRERVRDIIFANREMETA